MAFQIVVSARKSLDVVTVEQARPIAGADRLDDGEKHPAAVEGLARLTGHPGRRGVVGPPAGQ